MPIYAPDEWQGRVADSLKEFAQFDGAQFGGGTAGGPLGEIRAGAKDSSLIGQHDDANVRVVFCEIDGVDEFTQELTT